MQHFQHSLFYDLWELMRNAPLLRKYYCVFKALDLSALPDRNDGAGSLLTDLYQSFIVTQQVYVLFRPFTWRMFVIMLLFVIML